MSPQISPLDNLETNPPTLLSRVFENTQAADLWHGTSLEVHVLIVVGLVFAVHMLVKIVRHISEWFIIKSHAKKILSALSRSNRNL
jgi:hypothetical protein